jgi:hypothetical protein
VRVTGGLDRWNWSFGGAAGGKAGSWQKPRSCSRVARVLTVGAWKPARRWAGDDGRVWIPPNPIYVHFSFHCGNVLLSCQKGKNMSSFGSKIHRKTVLNEKKCMMLEHLCSQNLTIPPSGVN